MYFNLIGFYIKVTWLELVEKKDKLVHFGPHKILSMHNVR